MADVFISYSRRDQAFVRRLHDALVAAGRETWVDWERLVARFVDSGVGPGYGAIHRDIRPHPKFGTLEIRMPDQPTDVERTGALAALILQTPGRIPPLEQ